MELLSQSAGRAPLKCIIKDRRGRRMVMPRYTSAEAIEQIARAVAGRNASSEQKLEAWERLREQQGFRLEWVAV
jgi:hypothetical protein